MLPSEHIAAHATEILPLPMLLLLLATLRAPAFEAAAAALDPSVLLG